MSSFPESKAYCYHRARLGIVDESLLFHVDTSVEVPDALLGPDSLTSPADLATP